METQQTYREFRLFFLRQRGVKILLLAIILEVVAFVGIFVVWPHYSDYYFETGQRGVGSGSGGTKWDSKSDQGLIRYRSLNLNSHSAWVNGSWPYEPQKELGQFFFGIPVPAKLKEDLRAEKMEVSDPIERIPQISCGFVPAQFEPKHDYDLKPSWNKGKIPSGTIPDWRRNDYETAAKPLNLNEIAAKIIFPVDLEVRKKVRIRVLLDEEGNYLGHAYLRRYQHRIKNSIDQEIHGLKGVPARFRGIPVKSWIIVSLYFDPWVPLE